MANLKLTSPDAATGIDMTTGDMELFQSTLVRSATSTRVVFYDPDHPQFRWVLTGSAFSYDADHRLVAGTIAAAALQTTGGDPQDVIAFGGLHLDGSAFAGFVGNNDWNGFVDALLKMDDRIEGSAFDDVLDLSSGGNDTVDAGQGDDLIRMGAALTAKDRINGGGGDDVLRLDGDYSAGIHLNGHTVTRIAHLQFAAGNDYRLSIVDANFAYSHVMTVDGNELAAQDRLILDGSAVEWNTFDISGGEGNDTLSGGDRDDTFNLSNGGSDKASGGGGNDTFLMGDALDAHDRIDGGAYAPGSGGNVLVVDGAYTHAISLEAKTIANIQTITFGAGHSYRIVMADGNSAVGDFIFTNIDASALGKADKLGFSAQAETAGHYIITDGAGNDTLFGGQATTYFRMLNGGSDHISAGAGNDGIYFDNTFTAKDYVDGGGGHDVLTLAGGGGHSHATLMGEQVRNIEIVEFTDSMWQVSSDDAFVGAGVTVTLRADPGAQLAFDGSAEGDGSFLLEGASGDDRLTGGAQADKVYGSDGNDTLGGGAGDDLLYGGAGQDMLNGGAGADKFAFPNVSESNQTITDTIENMDWDHDQIGLPIQLAGIDRDQYAENKDQLAEVFSDSDELAPYHLALAHGNFPGEFVVVDCNGVGGYQPGADLLIAITNEVGAVSVSNFYHQIELQVG